MAGLIVRKDESSKDTDATLFGEKILKICTFKVRPEKRGTKIGELLLKQALWFAQSNKYDNVYLTTQAQQEALIDLIEYYGFNHTKTLNDKELVFEKLLSRERIEVTKGEDLYEVAKRSYPRFYTGSHVQAYVIPIRESYHDTLFPELKDNRQSDLLSLIGHGAKPKRPGNTIRKVYLCRAQANLEKSGSILFFYKGVSKLPPSQVITAIGIFEDMQRATSMMELMRLTGGRSVYSEEQLQKWQATPERPVKVINFLLAGYVSPPVLLKDLKSEQIFEGHPPQSIIHLPKEKLDKLFAHLDLGFQT